MDREEWIYLCAVLLGVLMGTVLGVVLSVFFLRLPT